MSKAWYETEVERAREAIERLAEFAAEMASDREAFNEGMKANCKTAMEFLSQLEDATTTPDDSDEVVMWRGLCHSRAVQLNEAYDEIARLRTLLDIEVKHSEDLQLAIDDMISH